MYLDSSEQVSIPKKRKKHDTNPDEMHIPKKKHLKDNHKNGKRDEILTLTQREEKALEALGKYFEGCGGKNIFLTFSFLIIHGSSSFDVVHFIYIFINRVYRSKE